jgi:hypothetical protein
MLPLVVAEAFLDVGHALRTASIVDSAAAA